MQVPFDEVYTEKKSKEVIDDIILSCGSCNLRLVHVIIVQHSDGINEIQAICPRCGERTFVKRFTGRGLIGTYDDQFELQDIKYSSDNATNSILVELKNVKK